MNLAELLQHVLADPQSGLKPSRVGPLRSTVKRYASCLGVTPEQCPADLYYLPRETRDAILEAGVPTDLTPNTIRNLKSTITWLMTYGEQHGYLLPDDRLHSWPTRHRIGRDGDVLRRSGETPHALYSQRYGLSPLGEKAPALAHDLEAYLRWCQGGPRIEGRGLTHLPARLRKTRGSCDSTRVQVCMLAGYAVNVCGMDAQAVTLDTLTDPAFLWDLSQWWIHERRGEYTMRLRTTLGTMRAIATSWTTNQAHADGIYELVASLGSPIVVRDKQARWLSLQQLLSVADSIYPLNERRLRENRFARRIKRDMETKHDIHAASKWITFRRIAWNVEASLLLRLMIEHPWRQRQYREMEIGKQLTRGDDGRWHMRFHGRQLKIAYRRGEENSMHGVISAENSRRIDEWLEYWRPIIVGTRTNISHMFINSRGNPLTAGDLGRLIKSITYRFTGVAFNPHLIRDVWATEYLQSHPGDYETVAHMLGNTVPMVIKCYGHIVTVQADARAEAFTRALTSA